MKRLIAALFALTTIAVIYGEANYDATQGSGTHFGSIAVATINYAQQLICDPTTPAQCVAVDASGIVTVKGSLTNISGTISLPTGAATSANQSSQLTQETTTATGIGAPADAAYAGSGSASIISAIKGVYNAAINGTATVRASYPAAAVGVGCNGVSAEQTTASTGQIQPVACDLVGKTVTSPYANRENMVRGAATATGTGATTVIAASGSAGLKTYVTDVECGRDDAGTTAIHVTFNDVGGTGSGTQLILPNNGGGGGNTKTFNIPIVTAANTAFTFTASTGITTVYCSAQGFLGY